MKKIVLISSYCNTQEKIDVLVKNIGILKKLGLDVMLNSPIILPTEVTGLCDYYIQTKENPVLNFGKKILYSWVLHKTPTKSIKISRGLPDYGWANIYQVKKLSEYALTYNYDIFYHIIYDLKIDDVVINALLSNDKKSNFYHFHEHQVSLHLMVFDRDHLIKFIPNLTLDEYLKIHGITEDWLFNLLKSNKFNYTLENSYVDDEIYYYKNMDIHNYSNIEGVKYFISKSDKNVEIYFYNITSSINLSITTDSIKIDYIISDKDIIDLGFNKDNIKDVVIEYDGKKYEITEDIKSIVHNFITII
jgi:hypothetical protein